MAEIKRAYSVCFGMWTVTLFLFISCYGVLGDGPPLLAKSDSTCTDLDELPPAPPIPKGIPKDTTYDHTEPHRDAPLPYQEMTLSHNKDSGGSNVYTNYNDNRVYANQIQDRHRGGVSPSAATPPGNGDHHVTSASQPPLNVTPVPMATQESVNDDIYVVPMATQESVNDDIYENNVAIRHANLSHPEVTGPCDVYENHNAVHAGYYNVSPADPGHEGQGQPQSFEGQGQPQCQGGSHARRPPSPRGVDESGGAGRSPQNKHGGAEEEEEDVYLLEDPAEPEDVYLNDDPTGSDVIYGNQDGSDDIYGNQEVIDRHRET